MNYSKDTFKISFKNEIDGNDAKNQEQEQGHCRANCKLSQLADTRFFVNEKKKTVVCVLEGYLSTPTIANKNLYLPDMIFKGVGVAKCAPDDKFDAERGKRIALARAENNIYIDAMRYVESVLSDVWRVADAYAVFSEKAYHTCAHNDDYVSSLSYEAHPKYVKKLPPLKRGK